ncbi:MAG: hypothetical protein KDC92_10015 [Bacteroidetes bacterium]|nr:hypothetical protein [Bacteroidota bacterium]
MKSIWLLVLFLPFVVKAQTKWDITSFGAGYYFQPIELNGLDYESFYNSFDRSASLPSLDSFKSLNTKIELRQIGWSFGFAFQLKNEEKSINRHSFLLEFRNGTIGNNEFNAGDNTFFTLQSIRNQQTTYLLTTKNEVFGIGLGYNYLWLSKGRFNSSIGAVFNFDNQVSKKMRVRNESDINPIDTNFNGNGPYVIEHNYFLTKTPSWYLQPRASFSFRIAKQATLNYQFAFGLASYGLEGKSIYGTARTNTIGLKYNLL